MLLGTSMVTNEFHHQTATTTFLTTPHRDRGHRSRKLVAAVLLGVGVLAGHHARSTWPSARSSSPSRAIGPQLGDWPVQRAILFNLLAYVLWAILGVGIGVLIRSQLGATITGAVLYLVGTSVAAMSSTCSADRHRRDDWMLQAAGGRCRRVASQLMVAGADHSRPRRRLVGGRGWC